MLGQETADGRVRVRARCDGKGAHAMQVAFLVAPEGVEQVELTEPWEAVTKADHTAKLVSTDSFCDTVLRTLREGTG